MKILLVTPPMSNLNTPYPATAYLTGFLRSRGFDARQADLSIELACRLLSRSGLARLERRVREMRPGRRTAPLRQFLGDIERHREIVEPVVAFLRGRNPGLESNILSRGWLPEGRFLRGYLDHRVASDGKENLEHYGGVDRPSYQASLYLWDLADVVREVEPEFELVSYGKETARATQFDSVLRFLAKQKAGLLSEIIGELVADGLEQHRPDVLGVTVPFPGNLPGALRIAETARYFAPGLKVVMGGGYPNTCLRQISDPRLFDFVDFLTLDDGERPLECVLQHLAGEREPRQLLRTFVREEGKVVYHSAPDEGDAPFTAAATPSYAGLPLENYIALRHSEKQIDELWSKRWNKLTLAHGCYWRKCTFCDISLDYVRRYEPQKVDRLIGQIEVIVAETGHSGFHWVDEAAPPALLHALCERLLERNIAITWWCNIRFDKTFTPELAALMARAGCVAVSGGLEVASDRLLKLIDKGVSVAQVARVARAFADNGILVHAYLMYGFPGETVQETLDSLEVVRQLFVEECLHSGFWHRLEATAHSPIGMHPEQFGVQLFPRRPAPVRRILGRFRLPFGDRSETSDRAWVRYHTPFKDLTGVDHAALGEGLWRALRNYQLGLDLDRPVNDWFTQPVPATTVPPDMIARALADGSESR